MIPITPVMGIHYTVGCELMSVQFPVPRWRRCWPALALVGVLILVAGAARLLGPGAAPHGDTSSVPLEHLEAIGYLESTNRQPDRSIAGVVFHDESRLTGGYYLHGGVLIDGKGARVNEWPRGGASTLLPDGSLVIMDVDQAIEKYTWNGDLLWRTELPVHHDMAILDDGSLLVLSTEVHDYKGRTVAFDRIVQLSPAGEVLAHWSFFENLDRLKRLHHRLPLETPATPAAAAPPSRLAADGSIEWDYDYYHANAIQALPSTPLGATDRRFRQGNWLISLTSVHLLVILDRDSKEVVWHWGAGELETQHSPRMLDNGRILVFDNGHASGRGYSRVLEMDPISGQVVWEYKGDPPRSFFSEQMGSSQRLADGNTLITDSLSGRAFEVDRDGELVWEWFNPTFTEEGERATVYRMIRYPEARIAPLIERLGTPVD